jgi:hypothetical protein
MKNRQDQFPVWKFYGKERDETTAREIFIRAALNPIFS